MERQRKREMGVMSEKRRWRARPSCRGTWGAENSWGWVGVGVHHEFVMCTMNLWCTNVPNVIDAINFKING